MKLEVGKTYVDGYGRKVRIVCTNRKCAAVSKPCIGLVSVTESEVMLSYYPDGGYGADYDPKLDLVEEYKEPSYTWANVYQGGRVDSGYISQTYADMGAQIDARNHRDQRIGLIRVNCETGQAENIKLEE